MSSNVCDNSPSLDFCRRLPKIELHAHINGSVNEETIVELVKLRTQRDPGWGTSGEWDACLEVIQTGRKRTMAECFQIFKLLQELSQTEEAAYKITRSVIKDFAEENVRYLELRTTPRAVELTGMTKKSYIDAVIKAVEDSEGLDIVVRLLLSIDRRTSLEDAMDTVSMAADLQRSGNIVVGVDLSGDPYKGDARNFILALEKAQKENLKLALHLTEVPGYSEEALEILQRLAPGRIGHGTFLMPQHGGSEQLVSLVREKNIPLELCLSSNVCTKTVDSYKHHHVKDWIDIGHPLCLCTDDKGIFLTSLSQEYHILAKSLSLSEKQLFDISKRSMDFIFSGADVREKLAKQWEEFYSTTLV